MPNRLSKETSPYLLQHAENPVDWYAWGEEALSRARDDDRPILLSIGYSACHWCHVMERESFEDATVAALMNELFVSIKVDREERPDIDQIYMKAVQAMTGGGGWPLTAFLTPDGIPYYGGTYFPPLPRHGMPSFTQVLRAAGDAYRARPEEVRSTGKRLIEAMKQAAGGLTAESDTGTREALEAAYRALANQYDSVHGGFGEAPKFPQPVTLELLMRHHVRNGEPAALEMAEHTLRRMAAGGMRDHLGGGFHRYSVDARWLVPHFEKMLYDNALLARVYLDAYRLTASEDLRDVAEDTLDYLATDMRSPEGGFYSARDADSEGVEGAFYVWTAEEIRDVLDASAGAQDAELFHRAYDVSPGGNFEGRNILHLPHDLAAIAGSVEMSESDLRERMRAARTTLLQARGSREAPFRDEKILVSWNGMAIRAFAEVGATLGRWDYVDIATEAADFLWTELRPEGELRRVFKDGESKIPAFLEDFAALGNALLSLHAASLDPRWLTATRTLCEDILGRFLSAEDGLLYDTPDDGERLIFRPRDPMDNATPSGVSLAAELLLRAGHVFDHARYRDLALSIFGGDAAALKRFGPAFGRMLSAADRSLADSVEVAIIGDRADDATRELVRAAHQGFARNLTIVGRAPDELVAGVPLLEEARGLIDGFPTAYVCHGYSCRQPVTSPDQVREQMTSLG
ncbi:MAG: thioredoxin domain-containing protein [Gemmatimonadetes bacterium]|nr:thioredoxin domain-containing protein [Gemmatimonadota bacterium]